MFWRPARRRRMMDRPWVASAFVATGVSDGLTGVEERLLGAIDAGLMSGYSWPWR